jgi:hypothetical protein
MAGSVFVAGDKKMIIFANVGVRALRPTDQITLFYKVGVS